MKFLIDTNIFIPLEPTQLSDVEEGTSRAAQFARFAVESGHQLYLHPAVLEDIRRDRDKGRQRLREGLFQKYPRLPDPPDIPDRLEQALGQVERGSNDWVDHCLLAALAADAADFLVTEDQTLRKKGARLGLTDRVTDLAEANSLVHDLSDEAPRPPPAVRSTKAHALDETDPIFDSFRQDYPGFDEWLRKCRREHRQAWTVEAQTPCLAGFCIVKPEQSPHPNVEGKALKICSFKVSDQCNGFRFGELLLKTVFSYCVTNHYRWVYVTVLEKHANLIALLRDFGFEDSGHRTVLGELVMTKPLSFTEQEQVRMQPLPFNIRFGPYAVKLTGVPVFVIPIQPRYHMLLFPEAERQLQLIPGLHPFGNSIKKAYLSLAKTRSIAAGSVLLFYRSDDWQAVTSIGIAEDALVSSSPPEIARYVGKRTVYSLPEIEQMCERGEVLALLFRQARLLRPPIPLSDLQREHALSGPPQSIVRLSEEALPWIRSRLGVQ